MGEEGPRQEYGKFAYYGNIKKYKGLFYPPSCNIMYENQEFNQRQRSDKVWSHFWLNGLMFLVKIVTGGETLEQI